MFSVHFNYLCFAFPAVSDELVSFIEKRRLK